MLLRERPAVATRPIDAAIRGIFEIPMPALFAATLDSPSVSGVRIEATLAQRPLSADVGSVGGRMISICDRAARRGVRP